MTDEISKCIFVQKHKFVLTGCSFTVVIATCDSQPGSEHIAFKVLDGDITISLKGV